MARILIRRYNFMRSLLNFWVFVPFKLPQGLHPAFLSF